MNQQAMAMAVGGSDVAPSGWLAFADPGRHLAGFAEKQVHWLIAPVSLGTTASAVQAWLLFERETEPTVHGSEPFSLLARVLDKTATKLGPHAARRLGRLATYTDGWDLGQGLALTSEALVGLERLLDIADFQDLDVALFLSHAGNVLLNWPDAQGELVELEVAARRMMCFIAATGEEFERPIEAGAVSGLLSRSR